MEDHKNQFVLILAGYPEEMDCFLDTNPGLPSRFPITISFPDYTLEQLLEIAELMVGEREYTWTPQALAKLKQEIPHEMARSDDAFSNARYIRNVVERAIRHHAVRLLSLYGSNPPSRQELMSIRPEDLKPDKRAGSERSL